MRLDEAKRRFDVPETTLRHYICEGFIRPDPAKPGCYRDDDFDNLGMITTLLEAGFTPEEIRWFLKESAGDGADGNVEQLLRKKRRCLLNDIHVRQRLLDNLDYIMNTRKQKEDQ
jgi:DNA-binding transcriptional MerR regulator